MLKQFTILGLVLLIAGGIGLVRTLPYDPDWVALGFGHKAPMLADASKTKVPAPLWPVPSPDRPQDVKAELDRIRGLSEETLQAEQAARLQADMERLAGGEEPDPQLAAVLYGHDWQEKVSAYKARREKNDFILTGSFVLSIVGLILFTVCAVLGLARFTLWIGRRLWKAIAKAIKRPPPPAPAAGPPVEAADEPVRVPDSSKPKMGGQEKGRARISVQVATPPAEEESVAYQRTYPDAGQEDGDSGGAEPADEAVERLWSDEKARQAASLQAAEPVAEPVKVDPTPVVHAEVTPVAVAEPAPVPAELEEALAAQNLDLERKLSQVKAMVLSARASGEPSAPEAAEPFNKTLMQLNEQISAIRQYAAQQQQQVEKLQSGYDWNIVRNFCLRVIRCIDNLEDRIGRLAQQGEETCHLDQVREELLFALESSGVEQFSPQVGSVFRGQERWAEALTGKETCTSPDLKGCIAAVVKPGYHYVVDDQNVKVVRAARVKLYGERDCS